MEFTETNLEIIRYLIHADYDHDMEVFNRLFKIADKYSLKYLQTALSHTPFKGGLDNLKGKNLYFLNGTSAHVIEQFTLGRKILLQVSDPSQGDLLEYSSDGCPTKPEYTILEVTDVEPIGSINDPVTIEFPLIDFERECLKD